MQLGNFQKHSWVTIMTLIEEVQNGKIEFWKTLDDSFR